MGATVIDGVALAATLRRRSTTNSACCGCRRSPLASRRSRWATTGSPPTSATYRYLAEAELPLRRNACPRPSSCSTCSPRSARSTPTRASRGARLRPLPEHLPEAVRTRRSTHARTSQADRERGVAGPGSATLRAVDPRVVLLPARCLRAVDRRRSGGLLRGSHRRRGRALDERRQAGAVARARTSRQR